MTPLTLLAPARDVQVAYAAIQAGADAVYIGASAFGARQAATNSLDDLRQLVRYARPYGVQILVTLNTLLDDTERKQAAVMAWQLYEAGVDALIIQDLRLLQENLPPIRLHASTQCDNRTPEQVMQLQQAGFQRVVLARELNIEEIRAIRQATTVELEAFVHGALCVSYSGRCYMSEVLTGRSANRGCCAQMCRMRYDLLDPNGQELTDKEGRPIHQRYLLSLQDMDRSAYLQELADAGVTTFKIEGRLKDADYVTNIVAYYRQKMDALFPHRTASHHRYSYSFLPNPAKTFHRGSTDYFLHGRTRPMAAWHSPKSTGEYIGTVAGMVGNTLTINLYDGVELHPGDGLCYNDKGFAVNKVNGNRIIIRQKDATSPLHIEHGTRLYRNSDTRFLASLSATRKIPVKITCRETDDGFSLTMSDTDGNVLAQLDIQDEKNIAIQARRTMLTMQEQLSKTGDTPYFTEEVELQTRPYFIPIQRLNEWRRQLIIQALTRAAEHRSDAIPSPTPPLHSIERTTDGNPPLMTCRYCILYEMGHCRKTQPLTNEPRYLRLQNGIRLQLDFHCGRCEMEIRKADG